MFGTLLATRPGISPVGVRRVGRFAERAKVPGQLYRFHAAEHLPAQHRALAGHRSQFTPLIVDDPTAFMMPPALLQHFRDAPELFLRG